MKVFGESVWESLFSQRSWGKYPSEEAIRFFVRAVRNLDRAEVDVLDLGCGEGALAWFFRREGASQVVAMDGSPSGLKNVPVLARSFGVTNGIRTLHGDITDPESVLKEKFDIIVDHYSLCANPAGAIAQAFGQCYRLLRDGGHFMTAGFGPTTTGMNSGEKFGDSTFRDLTTGPLANRGLVTLLSAKQKGSLLKEAGFDVYADEVIRIERDGDQTEKVICYGSKPSQQP